MVGRVPSPRAATRPGRRPQNRGPIRAWMLPTCGADRLALAATGEGAHARHARTGDVALRGAWVRPYLDFLIVSTTVVLGRRWASFTGMNCPDLASRPIFWPPPLFPA